MRKKILVKGLIRSFQSGNHLLWTNYKDWQDLEAQTERTFVAGCSKQPELLGYSTHQRVWRQTPSLKQSWGGLEALWRFMDVQRKVTCVSDTTAVYSTAGDFRKKGR